MFWTVDALDDKPNGSVCDRDTDLACGVRCNYIWLTYTKFFALQQYEGDKGKP